MTRRQKSSPLEDMFTIIARLPWWVGVVFAVVAYIGLHPYAVQSTTPATSGGNLTGTAVRSATQTLAQIFQYLMPAICLAAAAVSAWRRSQSKALIQSVTRSDSAAALDGMTWKEFESLVGEAFRQMGYKVTDFGGAGPDGGVDLALTKGSERFLVQCKQWKANKVGVEVIRELYGVMAAKGADGGFVVTSGRFTSEALAFAEGREITLIDGQHLFKMIQSAQPSLRPSAAAEVTAPPVPFAPSCPACGSVMVRREAKRGVNAGNTFWGCSTYPKCKCTAKI